MKTALKAAPSKGMPYTEYEHILEKTYRRIKRNWPVKRNKK